MTRCTTRGQGRGRSSTLTVMSGVRVCVSETKHDDRRGNHTVPRTGNRGRVTSTHVVSIKGHPSNTGLIQSSITSLRRRKGGDPFSRRLNSLTNGHHYRFKDLCSNLTIPLREEETKRKRVGTRYLVGGMTS